MQCKIEGCQNTDLASRSRLCRKHHREYTREHYKNNKEYYKTKARREKVALAAEVKALKEASPCTDCGVNYPSYVMDFDHLPGFAKVTEVTVLVRAGSRKKVFEEISKCELVCANCHRIRTHNRSSAILVV